MTPEGPVVCVHRVPDPIEANIIRGLLEQAGVAVMLQGEALTGGYSGLPKVADVRIMVPARLEEQARAIIDGYQDRSGDSGLAPWHCARCGEENDGGFEICWRCGHAPGEEQGKDDAQGHA